MNKNDEYKINNIKLKRKEKVYKKLKELMESLQFDDIDDIGFSAEYIGSLLNLDRINTSRELNKLLNEGKTIKIKGRPVLYLDRIYLKERFYLNLPKSTFESKDEFIAIIKENDLNKKDAVSKNNVNNNIKKDDTSQINSIFLDSVLDNIIGANDSLKDQISKAKAAILYPPNGLHTLIIGSTGVGKSTFAEAMYRYAIQVGVLKEDSPFVIFNCADYAENPQLLMSQLFGHVRGAFTGADKEKRGLIDEANGGIMFLDEVHRLPPEGQEMLFTLMDKGIYRRMGESESTKKSKVLIIAATTENPQSALLHTFLRRIPVMIQLPNLENRTSKERLLFIYQFFYEESKRVKMPIRVTKEVIKALMLYECRGNIGQLKSDIQLICARAFLERMISNNNIIDVKLSLLSQNIQEGLFKIRDKRDDLIISEIDNCREIIFDESSIDYLDKLNMEFSTANFEKGHDFYEIIINNWKKYNDEKLSPNEIREKIGNQIKEYFDKYVYPAEPEINAVNRDVLLKFVSPNILKAVEYSLDCIKDKFKGLISQKVIYIVTLHVKALLERIKMGTVISHPDRESIAKEYKLEYEAAKEFKLKLEEKLSIEIPEDEIAFLAMFLHALKLGKMYESIGILIIAHGNYAASTMASVANTLLGVDHAKAIDMPLEEKVDSTLDKAMDIVKQIDRGKGVLILVDMGSLTTFSEIITEKTGIPTKTIDMVSTPIVIEATRKALMPDMDLDRLVDELIGITSLPVNVKTPNVNAAKIEDSKSIFRRNLIGILEKTLTFLNPSKAYEILENVLKDILSEVNADVDDEILIKFLFHCSCMIERVIKGESLPYINLNQIKSSQNKMFNMIKKHFEIVEEVFGITIPDTELAYIIEMIDTNFGTLKLSI